MFRALLDTCVLTAVLSELSAVLSVQRAALGEKDSEVFDLRRHSGLLLGFSGDLPEPVDAAKVIYDMVRLLDADHAGDAGTCAMSCGA